LGKYLNDQVGFAAVILLESGGYRLPFEYPLPGYYEISFEERKLLVPEVGIPSVNELVLSNVEGGQAHRHGV
jgi:hypothetical protein